MTDQERAAGFVGWIDDDPALGKKLAAAILDAFAAIREEIATMCDKRAADWQALGLHPAYSEEARELAATIRRDGAPTRDRSAR